MAEEVFQQLLDRNQAGLDQHVRMPVVQEIIASGLGDMKRPVVLTCADPRADPAHYLHAGPAELATLRNAGGHVTDDVLRSLELISTASQVGMIVIIHHTDCGCLHLTDEWARETLSARSPENAKLIETKTWETFQAIGLEASVRNDVALMKKWPFLPKGIPVLGYTVDIQTGVMTKIE